jgi:hypothetical protein
VGPETICIGRQVVVRLSGEVEGIEGFGAAPEHGGLVLDLEVTRDPVPDLGPVEPVFESTGLWKVGRAGPAHVFTLPHLVAIVDFEAGSGRIHHVDPSAPAFDYPLDEVVFSKLLAERSAVIVHAAGVEHAGRGIILAGGSGAGKSTLASLFDAREHTHVLSDERVALFVDKGRFRISGTPWHGTSGHALDRSVVLERILFLHHATVNRIEPLAPIDTAARLASLSVIPYWHEVSSRGAIDAGVEAARAVPAASLGFVPDRSAVEHVIRSL